MRQSNLLYPRCGPMTHHSSMNLESILLEERTMDIRRYFPVMLGEHWIYILASVNSAVTLALLYTLKAPIHFGIW